jgi:CHAT domain-containing protein
MRALLKIFLIFSIYSCLTNYSYSKINELEILISSTHCAQKSINNQKPEIKFLGDARQLINFYKQQGNFLQLISFLDQITFCYRGLDEKNKKFYFDRHFEDIEFLISNENLINFKDKIEENNYYKLLGLYLFDQATSKNYEKKIPFLIKIIEKLQVNDKQNVSDYHFFLIFFDTKYVLYDDFSKLDKIFSIALNQLSLKKDQIEYFSLTKQLAKLYKTYNYKDCDNLFNRINKNFYPEGYLDFIKTAKIINSCYFTESEKGGYYYSINKTIDLSLFLEKKIEFFINNLDNNKVNLNKNYYLSLSILKNELKNEYLKTLLDLYDISKITVDQNLIKENYLEKYNIKNKEFFYNTKKPIYLWNNRPYIEALINKGEINKADDEINKSLEIINLSNEDFLDDLSTYVDKEFKTSRYDENLETARHTKESLKYDFLTFKSKILKLNNNYKDNVTILEKKLDFHFKNTYSPESYEWVIDIPESFGEIVESLLLLGDFKKADVFYQKGNKHCEKLRADSFFTYSRENKNLGNLECRLFYGKSFKLIIQTKNNSEITTFYKDKIKPVLDYFDEFDQKDTSLTKDQKNKRIVERETVKIDYFNSQKMAGTPEQCDSSSKLFRAVEESMTIFQNRKIFAALTFAAACSSDLYQKYFKIDFLEKYINASLKDYIEDTKYVKNLSALYNKSQDTDPVPSNIFMLLGVLDKETFSQNEKNKIKNNIETLFPILQLQDAEFIFNSNKNINSKYLINDRIIGNSLKEKIQLANQFSILNSKLFEAKNDLEIKNLVKQKDIIKDKIDSINLILKEKNYLLGKTNIIETPSISDIQKKLKDDEALIYIDTKVSDHIGSYLILKNDFNFFSKNTKKAIFEIISFLRRDIVNERKDFLVWSDLIYKKLFEKEANFLKEKKIKKIFIVVDKKLSDLPFEILVTNGPEIIEPFVKEEQIKRIKENNLKFLISDFSISYFPSVQTFYENYDINEIISLDTSFLGIGSPVFKKNVIKKDNKKDISQYLKLNSRGFLENTYIISERYKELPGAKKELNSLKILFKNSKVLLDNEATEKNFKKENLNQYGIIAFATHAEVSGIFDDFNEPFLVLTPPSKSNDEDDGLLTTSEISSLNLNARLVILSACDTAAKGNKYGDGFSGLINSFLIAGADSILATHWPVEDNASKILITQTVDKIIKKKLSTSEALKQTKVEFIEGIYGDKYKNPLFWAPYVIIGK